MNCSFQYTPLLAGQIRVLTLLPGAFSDDITITIRHVPIAKSGNKEIRYDTGDLSKMAENTFIALSYVWGLRQSPNTIHISSDDKSGTLSVTYNLEEALRHLRRKDMERVFWIDAICINQCDLDERSSQVVLMAHLYASAQEVIVWLGPEENDSSFALQSLYTWGRKVQVDWTKTTVMTIDEAGSEEAPIAVHAKLKARDSLALYYLFMRSWFERLWVKQEVINATPTTISCGNIELPMQPIASAVFLLYTRHIKWDLPESLESVVRDRLQLVYTLCTSSPETKTLERLRFDLRGLKWGEPVDAVYGTWSLLTPSERSLKVVPNYKLPPATVFTDVVLKMIDDQKTLAFLPSCRLSKISIANLPTWVPDWSSQIDCFMIYPFWSAAGFIAAQASISGQVLTTVAIPKATIQTTTDLAEMHGSYVRAAQLMRRLAPENLDDVYVAGSDMLTAYVTTFCIDYFADRYAHDRGLHTLQEAKDFMKQLLDLPKDSEIPDFIAKCKVRALNFYFGAATTVSRGRCFLRTKEGYIGLAPNEAEAGDVIFVLLGCRVPVVLRRTSDGQQWRVVGPCFVPGLMNGEAIYGTFFMEYSAYEVPVRLNIAKIMLRDANGRVLEGDAAATLRKFGLEVITSPTDPPHNEVSIDSLAEKGLDVQTIQII